MLLFYFIMESLNKIWANFADFDFFVLRYVI